MERNLFNSNLTIRKFRIGFFKEELIVLRVPIVYCLLRVGFCILRDPHNYAYLYVFCA